MVQSIARNEGGALDIGYSADRPRRRPAAVVMPRIVSMLLWGLLGLGVLVVSILPLLYAVNMAFYGETAVGLADTRSWAAIGDVYTSWEYLGYLGQALLLAAIVTAISMALGVAMAVLMARFRVPGKRVLDIMIIMPLFLSPFTGLVAWIALASPRSGFLNVMAAPLLQLLGADHGPLVSIWNFAGVVWILVLFFTPFAYLFTIGSFSAMNGSLEEAARTAGASPWQGLRRVTLPLSMPAMFGAGLLIFILSAEMYTVPGIVGTTAGFTTLPWKIYLDMTSFPVRQAHAAASGTVLLLICIAGILVQRRITRVSARFATIGGKGHPSKLMSLGRWQWLAFAFIAAYVLMADVLPLLSLLVSSFMKYSTGRLSWSIFTFEQYNALFTLPDARSALWNTIWLAVLTSLICVVVGFAICYRDVRRPNRWIGALTLMGVLPVAVPGMIYGMGLLWVYLRTPLYGTAGVLLLAYVAKLLPYAIVVSRSGLLQINRELEESARMSGAGTFSLLRLVTLPLMKPTLVTIAFFVMLLSIKELSASVLLYSPRGLVLSVLTWHYTQSGNYQFAAAAGIVQTVMMIVLVVVTRAIFKVRLENSLIKK